MDELLAQFSNELLLCLRILFGGFCGVILGLERSKRHKEAGIRTHFIVAAGSALVMTVSISFPSDPSRIAAQIVSGIGFLGAGMIFFRRENLHGLTTAAGIWATAGIGMAAGAGFYVIALGASLIVIMGQTLFHTSFMHRKNSNHMLLIKFDYNIETLKMLKAYFNVTVFSRFKAYEEGNSIKAEAVVKTANDCNADSLIQLINNNKNIHSVERLEDL